MSTDVPGQTPAPDTGKLPATAHLICVWPLLLVAIGVAIGGALGGLAYGVNVGIYKSKLPLPAKIILNIVALYHLIPGNPR